MWVVVFFAHRESDVEVATLVLLAVGLNFAFHRLHISSYREQSQAAARYSGIHGIGATEELLEQLALFLFGYAYSFVYHMEAPVFPVFVEGECDGAVLCTV